MRLLILFLMFSTSLMAQETMIYENIILTPNKKLEGKLISGVKLHNAKYHTGGKSTASLYSILTGPNSGKFVWLDGPMTYADLDQQRDAAHMADWGKNIQSYITDEKIKHAQLHWEASYTPTEFGSSDYLLIRTFKLNNKANSMAKVLEAITKIKEVLVATNASIVRRVYVSPFRSENGEDISLVYPFKSFTRFEKSNGLPENFAASYEEINGMGSWRRDIAEVLETYTNGRYDEIRVLQK